MSSRTQEPCFPADLDRFLPSFLPHSALGPQPGGMHRMISQGWVFSLGGAITGIYSEQGLFLELTTICPIQTWLIQPASLKIIAED